MRKKLAMVFMCGLLPGCAVYNMVSPPVATAPATPVFFQPFSSALDQPALSTIAAAARAANQQPNAPVDVTGAADTVGPTTANIYLSQTRAEIVANQLVTDGVAAARVHAHGIGETGRPGNHAQANRRAVITIGS